MYSQFEPQPENVAERQAQNVEPLEGSCGTDAGSAAEMRREQFLDRIMAQMHNDVGEAARQEMRQEIGAHLTTAASAYEELGMSPEAAMQEAIQRFGKAERVGSDLRREQASYRNRWKRLTSCATAGMGVGGMAAVPLCTRMDAALVNLGMVSQSSDPMLYYAMGALLGGIIGVVAARRQGTPVSALVQGVKCGALFLLPVIGLDVVTCSSSLPRLLSTLSILGSYVLLFSLVGAITGMATGALNQLLRHWLSDTLPAGTS